MKTVQGSGRKAPYAPLSALRDFFDRMRTSAVPNHIDYKHLRKLNIAPGNEWSLISALKFLEIIDDGGVPTDAYRELLSTDTFSSTLGRLVRTAYRDLLNSGGLSMSRDDLVNYFRVASSPSQARNAARFFQEVALLAGLAPDRPFSFPSGAAGSGEASGRAGTGPGLGRDVREQEPGAKAAVDLKAEILSKLPPPNPNWSAEEYIAVYDRFLRLLAHVDMA